MAKVSLARCASYEPAEVASALEACLGPLGGLAAFVPRGARVLIKPNLIAAHGAEQAATTHPQVVLAVARACLGLGAECVIGDSPAFGRARQVAARCGLLEGARSLGVPVVELGRNVRRGATRLSRSLADYDLLLSLPKLKAHNQLLLTAALKNTFGLVAGKAKAWRHLAAGGDVGQFCRMLLAVHQEARPALSIVDAGMAMDTRGPRGGRPVHLGLLAAGTDAAAIDVVLCRVLGIEPGRVPLLAEAIRLGVGQTLPEEIEVCGVAPEEFLGSAFHPPAELGDISFSPMSFVRSALRHLWLKLKG